GHRLALSASALAAMFTAKALRRGWRASKAVPISKDDLDDIFGIIDVLCEKTGPVRIEMPNGGKNFDRPRDQTLEKTLQRMSKTLSTSKEKPRGASASRAPERSRDNPKFLRRLQSGKASPSIADAEDAKEMLPVSLLNHKEVPIDGDILLADAFAPALLASKLLIGDSRYHVRVNRPVVESVNCRCRPIVGLPLLPFASGRFCDVKELRWEWRREPGGKVICEQHMFTPSVEDVGSTLCVTARPAAPADPRAAAMLGVDEPEASATWTSARPVTKPRRSSESLDPGCGRARAEAMGQQRKSWQEEAPDRPSCDVLRVLSYNVLADAYSHNFGQCFPYCDQKFTRSERRIQLCRQEVAAYAADLACLQEVDANWFEEFWRPQFEVDGYSGHFTQKVKGSAEGCALFFRNEVLELLETSDLALSSRPRPNLAPNPEKSVDVDRVAQAPHLPSAECAVSALLGSNPALADLWQRLGTIAQISLLRCRKDASRLVLVCNTHLYFANNARHIRAMQTALILEDAEKMSALAMEKYGVRPAVLFLGDLNSEPDTGAVELLGTGSVSAAHPDWARCAPFRWGFASSRQAARKMQSALKVGRWGDMKDNLAEDDTLGSCMERYRRMCCCLSVLGIGGFDGGADEDVPETDASVPEVIQTDSSASPQQTLMSALSANGTFQNSGTVASAQLALDAGIFSRVPVTSLDPQELVQAKKRTEQLAEVIKSKTEEAVTTQQDFTNFVGGYEAALDWIFFDRKLLRKVSEAKLPSREVVSAETALPSSLFPSDHLLLATDLAWYSGP
ncbi:unnamed protein product, partial [Polarella glacialis]